MASARHSVPWLTARRGGPTDITKIENSVLYVLVGILIAGAAACALAAIVLGAYAAQGSPRNVERYTGEYIRARYREEARTAATQLRRSRRAAIAAVLLLGCAIGVTWYGTPRTAADRPGAATPLNATPLNGGRDAAAIGPPGESLLRL